MQLLGYLFFLIFAIPFSYLPLPILHGFSNFLYFVLYKIIGYRKQVVRNNLTNSFPEKSAQEIIKIEQLYYKNLCDWIVETIKLFSISEAELKERVKFVDEEKWKKYAAENRHIIIAAGHYNNFEWGAQRITLNRNIQVVGLFTPLSNPYFNKFITKNRSRFGALMLASKDVKDFISKPLDKKYAFGFVGDQSPRKEAKIYWTEFLNQQTAVFTGIERYAIQLNALVVFVYPVKIKRGYYELRTELISDEPTKILPFAISEAQTRFLEKIIQEQPEAWMWSHKRWKLKRENL
jgi:Kdo2-lipid IVA lauroyltransferase/acyltransferase